LRFSGCDADFSTSPEMIEGPEMTSAAPVISNDPIESFMLGLEKIAYQPLLAHTDGTILLELTDDGVNDHWLITIDRGRVLVSNRPGPADAVVCLRRELFDSATRGRSNLWTALLRDDATVEGDLHLVAAFQRLLPGPTGRDPGPRAT
jgi:hypothetical protein